MDPGRSQTLVAASSARAQLRDRNMSTASQPPHGAQIRTAMTVSGLMMAHQVAGKATRDAIFLSRFKTTARPTMVATAALAAVVISLWRGRTLVRVGPFRVTPDLLLQLRCCW